MKSCRQNLLSIVFFTIGLVVIPSVQEQTQVPIRSLLEEYASLGRIVNAISLEQGLNDGSVDQKHAVRELLNIDKSINLKLLEQVDVISLSDGITEFVSAVEAICGENGDKCKISDIILKGFNAFYSIEHLGDYKKIFQNRSPEKLLETIEVDNWYVNTLENNIDQLGKDVRTLNSSIFEDTDETMKLVETVKKALHEVISFSWDVNLRVDSLQSHRRKNMYAIEIDSLKQHIDSILKLENIKSAFDNNNIAYNLWNKNFTDLKETLTAVKSNFSYSIPSNVEQRLLFLDQLLDGMKHSISQKKFTLGFHEGANDLPKLLGDLKSDFFLNRVMKLGVISPSLQFPYIRDEKSFLKTLRTMEYSKAMNTNIILQNVKKHSNSFKVVIKDFDYILSNFNCFDEAIKFVKELERSSNWEYLSGDVAETLKNAQSYVNKLNQTNFQVHHLKKLYESLNGTESNETLIELANMNDDSDAQVEINQMKASIDELNSLLPEDSKNMIQALRTVSSWFSYYKFDSIAKCLNNKSMLANIKTFLAEHVSLSEFLMINPNNLSEFHKISNLTGEFITEWAALEKSTVFSKVQEKSEMPTLENAQEVNRNLNNAIRFLFNLESAYAAQSDIENLLNHEKEIDKAITKSRNKGAKKVLGTWWTTYTKSTLRNITRIAAVWHNKTIPKPKDLSGYSTSFESESDYCGLVNINMEILIDNLIAVNSPYPDAESAGRLRNLHLNFANAKSILDHGHQSFSFLVPYFDEFTEKKTTETDEMESGSSEDDGISMLAIGCIAGGVLLFIIIIGVGVALSCGCGKNKKKEGGVQA